MVCQSIHIIGCFLELIPARLLSAAAGRKYIPMINVIFVRIPGVNEN
jgi:hypothetical protein